MSVDPATGIRLLADDVLLVTSTDEPGPALTRRLSAAASRLREAATVRDVVVAYREVAITFDRNATTLDDLAAAWNRALAVGDEDLGPGPLHRIPTRYDGPDLAAVAAALGCPRDEVVARHSAPDYLVAAIGFVPHFPYLLGLDPQLILPRRSEPRDRVPAGSVAIADRQAGIYPRPTPGGWHLLGSCDPALCRELQVGDRIRFEVVA